MVQILCFVTLILYLSHINTVFAKRRNSNDSNQQINDIIDKLLASDKFQKVTDLIINKTLNRLKMDQDTIYRHNKDKGKNDNEEHIKDNKDIKENGPVLLGKIDTIDFFKDKPTGKLVLHSKNFNKDLNTATGSDNKQEGNTLPPEKNNKKTIASELDNFSEAIKIESGDKSSIEEDNDSYDEKKKINFNDEASSFEKRKKKSKRKHKKHIIRKTKNSEVENKESSEDKDARLRTGKSKLNSTENVSQKTEGTTENNAKINRNETSNVNKQEIEPRSNISLIDVNVPAEENPKEDIFKSQEHETSTPKIKKNRYREENGKNYTYNSSPEYNDYHEKLNEMKETTFNFANL